MVNQTAFVDLREPPINDASVLLVKKDTAVSNQGPHIPELFHSFHGSVQTREYARMVRKSDHDLNNTNPEPLYQRAFLDRGNRVADTRNARGEKGKDNSKVVRL